MSYQLYRNTTLGNTLQESLDELIQVFVAILFYSGLIEVSDSIIIYLRFNMF